MSNIQIAKTYAKKMSEMTNEKWVSDNLPMLSRGERKAILKVYKKYFRYVSYDPATGVCVCSHTPDVSPVVSGKVAVFDNTGGDYGAPVTSPAARIETGADVTHIINSKELFK